MNILDNIYNVLFKPNEAFIELANKEYLTSSFLVVILVSIFSSLNKGIELNFSNLLIASYIPLNSLVFLFIWILLSMILTLTSDLMGGAGKITDTMIGVAYSLLPLIFIPTLNVLSTSLGEFKDSFYYTGSILIYLWSLALIIISLKNIHKFHITQSIMSIVGIVGIVLFFMLGMFVTSLSSIILLTITLG